MSALTDYILNGDLRKARQVAESDPQLAQQILDGSDRSFPADLAMQLGYLDLVAQFLRLGGKIKSAPPGYADLLRGYLRYLSKTYGYAGRRAGIAGPVWDQLYDGSRIFFESKDPEFRLSESEKKDILWLIDKCEVVDRQSLMSYDTL